MVWYAVGLLVGLLLYPVFLLVAWVTRHRRRRWLRRRGLGFRAAAQPLGGDGAGFAEDQDSRSIRHGDDAPGVKCGLWAK